MSEIFDLLDPVSPGTRSEVFDRKSEGVPDDGCGRLAANSSS
jgi:hypothetical protein